MKWLDNNHSELNEGNNAYHDDIEVMNKQNIINANMNTQNYIGVLEIIQGETDVHYQAESGVQNQGDLEDLNHSEWSVQKQLYVDLKNMVKLLCTILVWRAENQSDRAFISL